MRQTGRESRRKSLFTLNQRDKATGGGKSLGIMLHAEGNKQLDFIPPFPLLFCV